MKSKSINYSKPFTLALGIGFSIVILAVLTVAVVNSKLNYQSKAALITKYTCEIAGEGLCSGSIVSNVYCGSSCKSGTQECCKTTVSVANTPTPTPIKQNIPTAVSTCAVKDDGCILGTSYCVANKPNITIICEGADPKTCSNTVRTWVETQCMTGYSCVNGVCKLVKSAQETRAPSPKGSVDLPKLGLPICESLPGMTFYTSAPTTGGVACMSKYGTPNKMWACTNGTIFTINSFNNNEYKCAPNCKTLPGMTFYTSAPTTGGDFCGEPNNNLHAAMWACTNRTIFKDYKCI